VYDPFLKRNRGPAVFVLYIEAVEIG